MGKKCGKKLKCIPLSGNTDGVHKEKIAGKVEKQALEPIMQYIGFVSAYVVPSSQKHLCLTSTAYHQSVCDITSVKLSSTLLTVPSFVPYTVPSSSPVTAPF